MPRYEAFINDEGETVVYLTKRFRCHHKNGYKAVEGVRIPLENIPKSTLLKLQRKGLANETVAP